MLTTASAVLDPVRRADVARLCREGRALTAGGEPALALASYLEAWGLLPEPRETWESSTAILSAVGDLLREGGALSQSQVLDRLLRANGRTAGALAPVEGGRCS